MIVQAAGRARRLRRAAYVAPDFEAVQRASPMRKNFDDEEFPRGEIADRLSNFANVRSLLKPDSADDKSPLFTRISPRFKKFAASPGSISIRSCTCAAIGTYWAFRKTTTATPSSETGYNDELRRFDLHRRVDARL